MFLLSKIAEILTDPSNLLMVAMVAGAALLYTAWWRLGRGLILGVSIALLVLAVTPLDHWLLGGLENRFPSMPPPARVDGIIVLGGAASPLMSVARGHPTLNGAADRVIAMLALARRYPNAKVIYSGGSGDAFDQKDREAPHVRRLVEELGYDPARFVFEGRSRNTRENALFSKRLAHPRPGQTWLLVTSALHMPRAVGVFRAVGWPVTPYPVNYQTLLYLRDGSWLRFDVARQLGRLGEFAHEAAGLVVYRILGWRKSIFPAPQNKYCERC